MIVPDNESEVELFKEKIGVYCDDIAIVYAMNAAGSMPELKSGVEIPCIQLFNRLHITKEGYLNACCSDMNNMLAVADLKEMSLNDACNCEERVELRSHLLKNLIGNNI